VSILALVVWCSCGGATDTRSSAGPGSLATDAHRDVPSGAEAGAPPAGAPHAAPLETGVQLFRQGDLKGAEPYLTQALKSSPRDRRILEMLGSIYARTDRPKQAEDSFRAALSVEPASIGARIGLAAVLVDTGRYEAAQAMLADVLRGDPGNTTARLKGALLDVRLGHAAEAEAGAREVIARQPDSPEAHYVLGLALEQRGAFAEAAGEMKRVHDVAPGHAGALSHLVTLTTRLGRGAEAARWRAAQQEALGRLHVENRVRDHRLKGVEAFNRDDYLVALQEFLAIAREDPGDPQVYLHLGSTYMALGQLEESRRALERCLALAPRNERALAELGRLHALANRLDEAIDSLNKAIAVNPEFAEPHYYLAGVYMARGEADRYRQELAIYNTLASRSQGQALEIKPESGP